jgi:catechol 2,3-dioxygenase-like lactoylglutathione lyase family enzyme
VIALGTLEHVALRVADLREATTRWSQQFGLTERAPGLLSCDDEPYSLELIEGGEPGFDHVAWGLARGCSIEDAAAHLHGLGVGFERVGEHLELADLEGNAIHLLPYRAPASRLVAHARPAGPIPVGHPRGLGHVNFLTGRIHEQKDFYVDALGMRLTDWLGEGGVWLHIGAIHHEMALVKAVPPAYSRFHHLALDVVDIGQMRDALEEACFVELYCDMELLAGDHEPRVYPDDRYSSNTWGPLPPRSYFRFDEAAIESERESLEMQGVVLA